MNEQPNARDVLGEDEYLEWVKTVQMEKHRRSCRDPFCRLCQGEAEEVKP